METENKRLDIRETERYRKYKQALNAFLKDKLGDSESKMYETLRQQADNAEFIIMKPPCEINPEAQSKENKYMVNYVNDAQKAKYYQTRESLINFEKKHGILEFVSKYWKEKK